MEEMLDDTIQLEDDEELEEEADAEVDKVLFELTDGKLGQAGKVGTELPVRPIDLIRVQTGKLTICRLRPRKKKNADKWRNIKSNLIVF